MQNRKKSYKDHGVFDNEIGYIKSFCQNSNEAEKEIIRIALSEMDPYIAGNVYKNLVDGLSYEKICKKDYLFIGKGDFYGYCRRGVGAIKRWMILYNIWEM